MRNIQQLAAMHARQNQVNGLPCNPEGGTYRTRTDEEQAQHERNEAWWWRNSIIKCYGSVDNYLRILRRQHGVHDHPVKPKGI